MSTATTRKVLRLPGRLCAGPTDLTTAFPHGGVALGITRDAEFRFNIDKHIITAEEWGNIPCEIIMGGESAVMGCVLREFDNDMIGKVFLNPSAGTSSGDQVIYSKTPAATNKPGYRLSVKGFKLLFSPKAVDTHPHILMYNALPIVEESALVQASLAEELGIAVAFHAVPDSTGRVYAIGKREDLAL
jgi:hypothetical protein